MLAGISLACDSPLAFLTDLPVNFGGVYSYLPGADPILVINNKMNKNEQRDAYLQLLWLHHSATPERRRFPIKQVISRN